MCAQSFQHHCQLLCTRSCPSFMHSFFVGIATLNAGVMFKSSRLAVLWNLCSMYVLKITGEIATDRSTWDFLCDKVSFFFCQKVTRLKRNRQENQESNDALLGLAYGDYSVLSAASHGGVCACRVAVIPWREQRFSPALSVHVLYLLCSLAGIWIRNTMFLLDKKQFLLPIKDQTDVTIAFNEWSKIKRGLLVGCSRWLTGSSV